MLVNTFRKMRCLVGAFAKLRKATASFVMSVFSISPAVLMCGGRELVPLWTDFRETLCWRFVINAVEQIQV